MANVESAITPEVVEQHGLSPEEYERVLNALGREPNLVELGIFSVMWSEHCSYKSSRLHLKKLPTEAPWVICGPGENAGVIDIGDGQAAIFKMESHNHPSYIEPYQGAATGVGGILRDVFTMGARPVALMNALRFGRPDHPKMKHLIAGVGPGAFVARKNFEPSKKRLLASASALETALVEQFAEDGLSVDSLEVEDLVAPAVADSGSGDAVGTAWQTPSAASAWRPRRRSRPRPFWPRRPNRQQLGCSDPSS